jgi:hypothetical protein
LAGCGQGPLQAAEPRHRAATTSALAGGRLLLTNLAGAERLAGAALEPGAGTRLPVIVRSATMRLETAAALNANFPPVFANAAVDVERGAADPQPPVRYWVTDGGAVDNRGLEMLLYALRHELKALPAGTRLPRLLVVVADASAHAEGYAQDRGFSSLAGAGSRYASLLNAELMRGIEALYAGHPGRLRFAYVYMPTLLRESGSFGTHWMLQPRIKVRRPAGVAEGPREAVVEGPQMVRLLRLLLAGGSAAGLDEAACTVLRWSAADAAFAKAWRDVRDALGAPAPAAACEAAAATPSRHSPKSPAP